jgi:hypothetical protein
MSNLICVPVLGREKLYEAVADREELREVPPWMCWAADMPPVASREPAACRAPEDDIELRDLVPCSEMYEVWEEEAVLDVRSPTAVKAESSDEVKAAALREVEVGCVFMVDIYLSSKTSTIAVSTWQCLASRTLQVV